MNSKNTLDSKTHSFNPGQTLFTILALLVIVSFTSLSVSDVFAQTEDQENNERSNMEKTKVMINVVLINGACNELEKIDAVSTTTCDSDENNAQFLVITLPAENYRDISNLQFVKPVSGIYTDKMDSQLWLAYTDYLTHKDTLSQRGEFDTSVQSLMINDVQVNLDENECQFIDGIGIKENDFSCKDGMVVDVPLSNLKQLSDLDFVTSLESYFDCEPNCHSFEDDIYSDVAQTEDQQDTTKTTIYEPERMTFRVYFDGNDCTIPEKFDVIPLSKCEMTDGKPHMTISVLPKHVGELMFKMYSGIFPSKDQFKTDLVTFYKSLAYQVQKNNVLYDRSLGYDVRDIEDKMVNVVIAVEKDRCDFPDNLNIKLIDTDCSTPSEDFFRYDYQLAATIPISKLQELEQLDYVISIDHDYVIDTFIVTNVDIVEPQLDVDIVEPQLDVDIVEPQLDVDIVEPQLDVENPNTILSINYMTSELTTEDSTFQQFVVILIGVISILTTLTVFLKMRRRRIKLEA